MVVSAPTGSGKTVLFELAIVRLLMQIGEQMSSAKIVYGMTLSLFRTIVCVRITYWRLGGSCSHKGTVQ